jgi:Ca2+-binding RTX toxin-like protein
MRSFLFSESARPMLPAQPSATGWTRGPEPLPLTGPSLQTTFTGTGGADSFTGGSADDFFDMFQGGNDTVKGKGGDDTFDFGAAFTAADKIDGGVDSGSGGIDSRDRVDLDGDYSAGVVFGANTMVGVEAIELADGHSYNFTTHDNTVAANALFLVDGTLSGSNRLVFDGSAESDGSFWLFGGHGDDDLTGGDQTDTFSFHEGMFSADDRVDGRGGLFGNTVQLYGDNPANIVFQGGTMKNVDLIECIYGSASLTLHNANLAAGATLSIIATFFEPGETLTVDGSAERDGFLYLTGADANDRLTGGKKADSLSGNGGADTLTGGAGADFYNYEVADDSTGASFDTVVGFNADLDLFSVPGAVSAIDAAVSAGTLSKPTFDTDLAVAIDAAHLDSGHAVLFTPSMGGLAGKTFLVVDTNGADGYQAGNDLVIYLKNPSNLGLIDPTDFF